MRRFLLSLTVAASMYVASNVNAQVTAPADVNRTISYQAVLTTNDGKPVNGEHVVTARLYSDNKVVWEGTYTTQIENGVVNLQLGAGDFPLPKNLSGVMQLGVQIGNSPEMRQAMSSALSALSVANGAITAENMGTDYVASISVDGKKVSGVGANLNIVSGDGMKVDFDAVSNTLTVKSAASSTDAGKNSAQANSIVTGTLTVTKDVYLNTTSGNTTINGTTNLAGGLGANVDANGYTVTGLGSPSANSDAATKQYVDDAIGNVSNAVEFQPASAQVAAGTDAVINLEKSDSDGDFFTLYNAEGDETYALSGDGHLSTVSVSANELGSYNLGSPIDVQADMTFGLGGSLDITSGGILSLGGYSDVEATLDGIGSDISDLESDLAQEIQDRIDGDAQTLSDANDYADAGDAQTLSDANDYADAGDAQTLSDANDYADAGDAQTLSDANDYADAGDAQTLSDANDYADAGDAQTLSDANDYADAGDAQTLSDANDYADAGDAQTLSDANDYADAGDAQTLSDANDYADAGDAQTLSDANDYADAGDAQTLSDANDYTDAALSGLGTISTQDADDVMITGGAISFTAITDLAEPTNDQDAATKFYVDNAIGNVDLSDLEDRVDQLELDVDDLESDLGTLSTQVGTNTSDIAALQSAIDDLEDNVTTETLNVVSTGTGLDFANRHTGFAGRITRNYAVSASSQNFKIFNSNIGANSIILVSVEKGSALLVANVNRSTIVNGSDVTVEVQLRAGSSFSGNVTLDYMIVNP